MAGPYNATIWPNLIPSPSVVVGGLYPLTSPPVDPSTHVLPVNQVQQASFTPAPLPLNTLTVINPDVTAAQTRAFFGIIQATYPPTPIPSPIPQ